MSAVYPEVECEHISSSFIQLMSNNTFQLRAVETSSKRDVGVADAFHELARQMTKRHTRLEMKKKVKGKKSRKSLNSHRESSHSDWRTSSRRVEQPRGQAVVYKKNPGSKSCVIM
jgi:hypothetical protein